MKQLCISITDAQYEELEKESIKNHYSMSEVIRFELSKRAHISNEMPTYLNNETTHLHIKMLTSEKQELCKKASDCGLSMSSYVRHQCLNETENLIVVDTDELRATVRELIRQGTNLNQIAKRLNELSKNDMTVSDCFPKNLDKTLDSINDLVLEIKSILAKRG